MLRGLALLALLAACSPATTEMSPDDTPKAMAALGDYDGDGLEDRAELWIKPDESRLLVYLGARPGEAILAHVSAGPSDYLRTRPASSVAGARFDVISYGSPSGEVLLYWTGERFEAAAP